MGEEHQSLASDFPPADDGLETTAIPEDWGGDGQSRMNLSGRCTAISPKHLPRQYQFFDTQTIPEEAWQMLGVPGQTMTATRQLLSWHENGAFTAKAVLPAQWEIPAGRFTADLEIFVLNGAIQIGEWILRKHCYSFIPAGMRVGAWNALEQGAEVLWMENDRCQYQDLQTHPKARIKEFIPVLDSKLLPWGRTDTTQFVTASKKWLRRAANGGGVWLITLLPHYDGQQAMIQSYNEEGFGLAGCCDIGDYAFAKDHFAYCPSFCTSPRHISEDGSLFFIRIDRDLSQAGTVLSYAHDA